MTMLGFGQKVGQVIQTAYVVEDIHDTIDWWAEDANTGPWFVLDSFTGPGHISTAALLQQPMLPSPWDLPGICASS
jgi:hypothetical protein